MIELMTVEDEGLEPMIRAYEQIFDVLEQNKLTPEDAFGLLIRMTVQLAGDIPKSNFLTMISEAHDIDRFLRGHTKGVH